VPDVPGDMDVAGRERSGRADAPRAPSSFSSCGSCDGGDDRAADRDAAGRARGRADRLAAPLGVDGAAAAAKDWLSRAGCWGRGGVGGDDEWGGGAAAAPAEAERRCRPSSRRPSIS
jgi:hypothetical protein